MASKPAKMMKLAVTGSLRLNTIIMAMMAMPAMSETCAAIVSMASSCAAAPRAISGRLAVDRSTVMMENNVPSVLCAAFGSTIGEGGTSCGAVMLLGLASTASFFLSVGAAAAISRSNLSMLANMVSKLSRLDCVVRASMKKELF